LIETLIQAEGNKFGEMIELIVRSPQFRTIRGDHRGVVRVK
jgi:hypothetical protein